MKYRIAGRSLNVSMSQCFEIYCTVLYLLFIVLYIVVRSQATFHLFIKRDQNRVPYLALDFKVRHYLVNGIMVVPTLEQEAGKWMRLYISFAE